MIEQILLNVFFVILPLILLPIFCYNNYDKFLKIRTQYIFITTFLASIACSIFTIQLEDFNSFDFHFIPQLYASLYLGPLVSFIFFIYTIGYQALNEDPGLLIEAIISGSYVILSILYSAIFNNSSSQRKIFSFTLIHIITGLFGFSYLYISNGIQNSLELIIGFIVQAFAAAFVLFFSEYIRYNLLLQSRLMNTEKMDIVSHLAASISHEVRNPLTTVRGFLQLLSKMYESEKSKEYIQISIDELDRAEAIISDYLTFAKPSENKATALEVESEFRRMIEIMKPLANQNNVQIEANLQKELFICGEQQAFQQCIINIMKNSIEAMNKGGLLSIMTSLNNGCVFIKISDNGVGMTREQMERIGEPYFSTKGSKGTGLGMVVVLNIIKTMAGTIEINSEAGKGTEIMIRFPLADITFLSKEVAVAKAKIC